MPINRRIGNSNEVHIYDAIICVRLKKVQIYRLQIYTEFQYDIHIYLNLMYINIDRLTTKKLAESCIQGGISHVIKKKIPQCYIALKHMKVQTQNWRATHEPHVTVACGFQKRGTRQGQWSKVSSPFFICTLMVLCTFLIFKNVLLKHCHANCQL